MSQESRITTLYDMTEYLLHYGGMDPQKQTVEDCRRAVVNGLREFSASHPWSFFLCRGRVVTVSPYSTGTIAYNDTTRGVTLSGGTWPTWAAFGSIRINNVPYDVASLDSGTQITLARRTPVGSDVVAGTAYSLYRDTYPMPVDYQASGEMIEFSTAYVCQYLTTSQWLEIAGSFRITSGKPVNYSVLSDPHYLGAMSARFYPIPDRIYAFDFIYKRLPRYLVVPDTSDGAVSVGAASDTVTGISTNWASRLAGSIIRFGTAGDKLPPTSLTGSYPYTYERTVLSVTNATTLVLDLAIPEALTTVPYRISDPIDVEEGACMTALHRECEKQLRLIRRMRPLYDGDQSESKEYTLSYIRAREADKRGMASGVAGGAFGYRRRVSEMRFLQT